MDDIVLSIKRCLSHDCDSFEEVHDFFCARLRHFLRVKANSPEDAEDLFIIVTLEVWQKLDRLREPNKIWPWVRIIAENRIKDYYKGNQKKMERLTGSDSEYLGVDNRLETDLIHKEARVRIRHCIYELPLLYRACAVLYFLKDLSPREIAALLETELNTVKSHIYRARLLILKKMQH